MRTKRNGRLRRVRRGNCLSLGTVPVTGCHFYWTAHTSPLDVDFQIRLAQWNSFTVTAAELLKCPY